MLYMPPGFPHEGYALENALNYSVGFRAPSSPRAGQRFCRLCACPGALGGQRYSDPAIESRDDPAHILLAEVDALRAMMMALMQQPDQFNQWVDEFISQSRYELDLAPPEPPYQAGEIYDLLNQGESLFRVGGLRVLRVGDDSYINGEKIVTPHRHAQPPALRRGLFFAPGITRPLARSAAP